MDEEIRRTPSLMKDCIKRYFYEGWTGDPTRQENHRIVAWLVIELHRMRFKDEEVLDKMVSWANKSYHNIPARKLESLKRHVLAILKKPYELGCPRKKSKYNYQSVLADICFREVDTCFYHEEFNRMQHNLKTLKIDETNYHRYGWPKYLLENHGSYGFYADLIYSIMREWESENNIPPGGKLYISYRKMTEKIQLIHIGPKPYPMEAVRATRVLEQVGLVEIVERGRRRGERAISQPRANGYRRILPIPKPPDTQEKTVVTHTYLHIP